MVTISIWKIPDDELFAKFKMNDGETMMQTELKR